MTRKQFLLNVDGSVPAGVDVDLLIAEGIPMVMPTDMPREPGMVAVEQDPLRDADGTWRQVWALQLDQEQATPAEPV
jgi:hypothetical protein